MAGIMATMMVLTMMQTTAFAKSEETNKPSTETICEASDDTTELSSQEEGVESGGKPGEADASSTLSMNNMQKQKTHLKRSAK